MLANGAQVRLTERNWAVLALLRFCLAFIVLMHHTADTMHDTRLPSVFGWFPPVAGFFVISGYSIAHSVTAHPDGFYRRRFLRIYPLAFAGLIYAIAALILLTHLQDPDLGIAAHPPLLAIAALFFLLNGIVISTPMFMGPYWSLGCEAIYYLTAPWLRKAGSKQVSLLALASLGFFTVTVCRGIFPSFPGETYGVSAICLMWIWLGGFLAYRHPLNPAVMTLAILPPILIFRGYFDEGTLSLPIYAVSVLIVCILPVLALPTWTVHLSNYLGDISYPLYLSHFTTIFLVKYCIASQPLPVTIAACWIISLLVAALFYHFIDLPFRKRKKYPVAP